MKTASSLSSTARRRLFRAWDTAAAAGAPPSETRLLHEREVVDGAAGAGTSTVGFDRRRPDERSGASVLLLLPE